jgi:hypothetical protein
MTETNEKIRAKMNAETGKLVWQELQPHYARGVVVKVSKNLDLVEAAVCFVEDDKQQIERWLTSGDLERAMEDDAKRWVEQEPVFWAVVVAPWVLAQEKESPDITH